MNRWQALVEIVRSFNERGKYGHAIVATALIVVAPVLLALMAVIEARSIAIGPINGVGPRTLLTRGLH